MEDSKTWQELCARAAVEQDSNRLHGLTEEIIRLLDIKLKRLDARTIRQRGQSDSGLVVGGFEF